ncbi:MAG: hypothetical protein IPM57_10765 [Oligoflexia bacterium]|nr:hypothetical protein [Oligoflexia bacterium]
MISKIKSYLNELLLILGAPSNRLISYSDFKVGTNYKFEHNRTILSLNINNGNFVAIVAHPVSWGVIGITDYHISYVEVSAIKGSFHALKAIKNLIKAFEPDDIFIGGGFTGSGLISFLKEELPNLTVVKWHYTAKTGKYTSNRAKCLFLLANTIKNRLLFVTDTQALPIFKDMAMLAMYLKVTETHAEKLTVSGCNATSPKQAIASLVFETLAMTHYNHED